MTVSYLSDDWHEKKNVFVRLIDDGRGAVLSPYGSDGDDAEPSSHDHVLPRVDGEPERCSANDGT